MQYAAGYPITKQKIVETAPNDIDLKNTEEYLHDSIKFSKVKFPEVSVKENITTKLRGTITNIAIHKRYGNKLHLTFNSHPPVDLHLNYVAPHKIHH